MSDMDHADGERALGIRVVGQVQGVGYRAFTQAEAEARGIKGWVVNRDDGSVEAALHGPGQALAELIGRMRHGPPSARVDSLDVRSIHRAQATDVPATGFSF